MTRIGPKWIRHFSLLPTISVRLQQASGCPSDFSSLGGRQAVHVRLNDVVKRLSRGFTLFKYPQRQPQGDGLFFSPDSQPR